MDLKKLFPKVEIVPIIGDVRIRKRLSSVINVHKPRIIFHTAAYKHVPMMEANPFEALRTNIGGD